MAKGSTCDKDIDLRLRKNEQSSKNLGLDKKKLLWDDQFKCLVSAWDLANGKAFQKALLSYNHMIA